MKKAVGQLSYQRYLRGERLSLRQAADAKCYECTGGYADGVIDCCVFGCPLYPYMPYSSRPAPKVNKGARARKNKTWMEVFDGQTPLA